MKRTILATLVLFAGAAYAQPTPVRIPPKYTVATAPACVDGEPKLYAVTDGNSSTDCAVGGGSTDVICQCKDGTASAVGSGGGGTSNSFETINAPAGTDPVADSATDTLNITCAGGLTCTGTAATDTLDFTMGTATAATALAANGANCSAGQFPLGVDASGAVESCTADDDTPDSDSEVPDSITVTGAVSPSTFTFPASAAPAQTTDAQAAWDSDDNRLTVGDGASTLVIYPGAHAGAVTDGGAATTATALAANGANCSAGQYPLGVDASGAVESCTADSTTPASDSITEAMLKAVDAAADEECLTYESTVGDFEWQTCGSAGIGGSTGATDRAILISDGTGGTTAQASSVTLSGEVSSFYTLSVPSGKGFTIASDAGLRLTNSIGTATGIISYGGAGLRALNGSGTAWETFAASTLGLPDTGQLKFGNSWIPEGPWDFGIERLSVGVGAPTNGGTGVGWINNQAGDSALSTDFTNSTATMENLTGLSVTLLAGRSYTFRLSLMFSDSVAGEGAKFDFDGGTATATAFKARCTITDSALLLSATSTALATDFAVATATGDAGIECSGSFVVNAAGTFIPRAAQNSHSTGTLTVEDGSHWWVHDTSFN
jgi:hypothetical protein